MRTKLMLVAAGLIFAMIACGTVASMLTGTTAPVPTATAEPTPEPYLAKLAGSGINLWEAPFCEITGKTYSQAGAAGDQVRVVRSASNACGEWLLIVNSFGVDGWVLAEFIAR